MFPNEITIYYLGDMIRLPFPLFCFASLHKKSST